MKSVFILLCSFVFGSSIIFSQSSSDCFLSPSNVSILDELKSQTFCSSDDHLSNYKLDKNGINLYDQSGIYTIKLKAHIIQYSANDPRNYTTADIPQILTAIDNVNTIYSSLASTSLTSINPPLVPLSQEESDSRIRFSLSSNDIEFVVDPVNHIGLEDQIHTINTSILEVIDSKTIIVSGQYTADMMYSTQKAQYIIISGSQDNDGWYRFQSANVVIENGQLAVKTKISLVDDLNNVSDLTGAVNYSSFNYTYDNYHNLYHATDKTAIHIYFQKIGTQYYNIGFGSAKELNSNMLSMVNSQGPNGSIDHKLLAHELGHCLGLPHTWNLEYEKPQINDLYWDDNLIGLCNTTTVSNNILGYNTCRNYLSPLQIAYIRKQLNSDINIMQKVIESQQSNNNNVTITGSNVIWDQREIIGGTLTVESGATLTIKCKVHFSPDGKVVVKPNGRLIIDGGLLTNELGQQWKGIEVWGTTTQHQYPTQQPTYQGRLELKNGGTIENALIAASNWKPQDYNKVGGVIISNGGVFLNNRQAIEMVTYDNFIPGNPSNKVSNLTSFTNTDFTINDDYLGDKNAFFYHVTLWDVFGINFQNCHFTNDIAQKSFLGSRNKGIYTLDAGFTVKAGCTSTPPLGQQCPTQNLLKSTFSGFHMGIEATGAAVEQAVSVSQSVFDNNIMGIDFETLDNFSVNRNTIKIGNPGYTDYTSTYFGIRSNLSTGFQIEENNVEKYNGIPNTYGISVSSAGIANNRVYKNRTEGMMYGQYYVGVNRNALNQYEGLQFL